jgi:TonB family protein
MALTGQLSDMSLAELIEFFCNQRKTGRLKVDYHRGHGVFFIKDGELVDAKVGALSGADAVYFALTLPNAAFDFSTDFEPPRRTIGESWTQVVLEGLRRLDEGASPGESDAFGADWKPSEADVAMFMDQVERLGEKVSAEAAARETAGSASSARESETVAAPMSMMVESASAEGGGKRKMLMLVVVACVVLACGVAAIPLSRRFSAAPRSSNAASSTDTATQNETSASDTSDSSSSNNGDSSVEADASTEAAPSTEAQPASDADAAAADPNAAAREAQRLREARERATRERERKLEEARRNDAAQKTSDASIAPSSSTNATAAPAPAAGPKTVRVSVSYDESGRVTQASVAGTSAGAEAYGATAVRIARGRRFPAGKAGGTVITIPIN